MRAHAILILVTGCGGAPSSDPSVPKASVPNSTSVSVPEAGAGAAMADAGSSAAAVTASVPTAAPDIQTAQISGPTTPLSNPNGGYKIGVIDHGSGPSGDAWFHVDARTRIELGTVTNHTLVKPAATEVTIGQLTVGSIAQVTASGVVRVKTISDHSVLRVVSTASQIIVTDPIPDGSAVEYIAGTPIQARAATNNTALFPKPVGWAP